MRWYAFEQGDWPDPSAIAKKVKSTMVNRADLQLTRDLYRIGQLQYRIAKLELAGYDQRLQLGRDLTFSEATSNPESIPH